MRKKKTGFVVIAEHDAKPLRGRKRTLSRVPQYKIDKNIESLLSHFNVYFDTELQSHVVPIRPRWAKWFGYKDKNTRLPLAEFVVRANGVRRSRGVPLSFLNGDGRDYCATNLVHKSAMQVEKESLNATGKQRCSACDAIKSASQFIRGSYECEACRSERGKKYRAEKSKQSVCRNCGDGFDGKGRTHRYCSEACRLEMVEKRKSQVTGQRVCECCGKPFGVNSRQHMQKFCSAECKTKGGKHEYTCDQCGKEYLAVRTRQRFCSQACKHENSRTYKECEGCGKTFHRRRGGGPGKDDYRFCNKKCCGEWRKRQTAARRQVERENLFLPYSLTVYKYSQKLDAKLCEYLRKQLKPLQDTLERKQLANWLKNGPCEECGKPKGRTPFAKYCGESKYFCKSCASKLTFWELDCERCGCDIVSYRDPKGPRAKRFCKRCQKHRSRKLTTHKKRCERRGLPHDPAVKTTEIGNRANWHCEICKEEILRVWTTFGPDQIPHPLAPTIDHIVPLMLEDNTKHGHTWENTQLACFDCNSDKSDDCELWLTECDDPRKAIGLKSNVFNLSACQPRR